MGTTFTNLQIRTGDKTSLKYTLPTSFCCVQTAENWVTVYEKDGLHDFIRMQKLGRKMSKEIDFPIIAVSFFDDDEFEMQLLEKGKIAAVYRMGSFGIFVHKSTAFINSLGLSTKEASAFRYLLKKEMTAQESIAEMSRLLGIKLYTDLGLEREDEPLFVKDAETVIARIDQEKKKSKVKNHSELIIHDEILGMRVHEGDMKDRYRDAKDGVIRMVVFDQNGECDFARVCCFREKDEKFEQIHEYNYPEEVFFDDSYWLSLDYENRLLMVFDSESNPEMVDWETYQPIIAGMRMIPEKYRNNTMSVNEVAGKSAHSVVIGDFEYDFSLGKLQKTDWSKSGDCYSQRNVVAEYAYEKTEDYFGNETVILAGDLILFVRTRTNYRAQREERTKLDVRFFDEDLNLVRKEEIPFTLKLPPFFTYAYDEESDTIFLGVAAVNLKTHGITACPENLAEGRVFTCMDKQKNVYIAYKEKLYIFSTRMELLSVHKFKGVVKNYYVNDKGNVCFIASSYFEPIRSRLKKDSGIRLYEVVMMDKGGKES